MMQNARYRGLEIAVKNLCQVPTSSGEKNELLVYDHSDGDVRETSSYVCFHAKFNEPIFLFNIKKK